MGEVIKVEFVRSDRTSMLLKPDGSIIKLPDEEFTLKQLQEYVGGYIETCATPDKAMIMIVDEEGILKGKTLNMVASKIAGGYIHGDVVIMPIANFK